MKVIHFLLHDPMGRPGIGFSGAGLLLNITERITHTDALFYASMYSFLAGGTYYLVKIIFEFIKKGKS